MLTLLDIAYLVDGILLVMVLGEYYEDMRREAKRKAHKSSYKL